MIPTNSTEAPYALDISSEPLKRTTTAESLNELIRKEVKATQSVIIRAYPNRLLLSKKQYALLSNSEWLLRMQDVTGEFLQDNYLYRTPFNIMEVEVKD